MDNSGVIPAELALASESRNPGINILLDARFREHDEVRRYQALEAYHEQRMLKQTFYHCVICRASRVKTALLTLI